jgi:hypothetical protein
MSDNSLRDVISDTLDFELVDCGDTVAEVDRIFDNVEKTLRRDSRLKLSSAEFELLFADAKRAADNALQQYQKIDWNDAANMVTERVVEHIKQVANAKRNGGAA